mgnify:CR=1 FL=1
MIGVSDTQPVADSYSATGPCLLGSISEETAQKRAASVAQALATTRDIDLLVSGVAPDMSGSLPESHRDAYCSVSTTVDGESTLDPVVTQHDPSVLVLKRHTQQHLIDELFSDPAERFSRKTDVLTVDSRSDADSIASILVPVAGGDHSQLAVETAVALARANDAAVDLFHVIEADTDEARAEGRQFLDEIQARIDPDERDRVDTWLYETPGAADAITEQSEYYDLTVMGAPTDSPLKRFVFGSTSKQVQREAESPVIVAHTHQSA